MGRDRLITIPYAICHMEYDRWRLENDGAPEILLALRRTSLCIASLYNERGGQKVKTALILATCDQQSGKRHPVDRIGAVRAAVRRKRRAVRSTANNRRAGARNQSRLRNRPQDRARGQRTDQAFRHTRPDRAADPRAG